MPRPVSLKPVALLYKGKSQFPAGPQRLAPALGIWDGPQELPFPQGEEMATGRANIQSNNW